MGSAVLRPPILDFLNFRQGLREKKEFDIIIKLYTYFIQRDRRDRYGT